MASNAVISDWNITSPVLDSGFSVLTLDNSSRINNLAVSALKIDGQTDFKNVNLFDFRGEVTGHLEIQDIAIKSSKITDTSSSSAFFNFRGKISDISLRSLSLTDLTAETGSLVRLNYTGFGKIQLSEWALSGVVFS